MIGVKRFANFLCYCVQLLVDTLITRSSRLEVSCKTIVVRNFAKFTGKHLFQSLFFNKIAGLMQEVWLISRSLLNKVPWVPRVPKCPSAQVPECLSTPAPSSTLVLKWSSAQVSWKLKWLGVTIEYPSTAQVSFEYSNDIWALFQ